MNQASDHGVLTGVVQGVGWLVSATAAILMLWRRRANWEPSEQDVPRGAERVAGLVTAIVLAVVFTQLNGVQHTGQLIRLAMWLGGAAVLAFLTYSFLTSVYTFTREYSPAPNVRKEEKIIGGFALTPDAQIQKEKRRLPVQDLLRGAGNDPDRIWTRTSRAFAKQVFVAAYILLIACGTIALACAGILLMLSSTPATVTP
jgi:hypothetical protein